MADLATITSKRQLTIPVSLFKKAKFREGQKVLLEEEKGAVKILPATLQVEILAGSVKIPKRFKGLTTEEILSQAKKDYFSGRIPK